MKKQITLLLMLCIAFVTYAAVPTITSFRPGNGAVGTLVTITGTNLGSITTFTIGGTPAIVVADSGTKVVGMVMPGAVTGAISITAIGGTVTTDSNFTVAPTLYPRVQQGPKLTDSSVSGTIFQGWTVALSADGNTAIVGGVDYNSHIGAAWIYIRTGTSWAQQGPKLTGTDATAGAQQGTSVALSADGNTAIVGGDGDSSNVGAAWIYLRKDTTWKQIGKKLCGSDATANAMQGSAVALSSDGNIAVVGGQQDNTRAGAIWVYARTSDTTWAQHGPKMAGNDNNGSALQGASVAISRDGNTIIEGGFFDNFQRGAVWVFVKSGANWIQQGPKLVATGGAQYMDLGNSIALSADGNTIIAGAVGYNSNAGSVWIFTRTDTAWRQQGPMLVGTGAVGNASQQGSSVSISADGNVAIWGGPTDNNQAGTTWVFTRTDTTWTQRTMLVGSGALGDAANQGQSVALSADGTTAIIGGPLDNHPAATGAVWIFGATHSLNTSYTADSVSCASACNATAVINVTGGQGPYSYSWNTIPQDTTDSASNLCSGTYIVTVYDAVGYRAVVNVTIGQKAASVFFDTVTICAGTSYSGHSQTGIFTDTLTSVNGCDSIVTLNLTVNNISQTTTYDSICAGNSFNFNGVALTIAGTYRDTLTSTGTGCDSVITLNLFVESLPVVSAPADTTVCVGSTVTLLATSAGNTIMWLGGYTNGQTVTIIHSTQFVVSVNALGCAVNDTFSVQSLPASGILHNANTAVCADDTITLWAGGGTVYNWHGSISGNISTDSVAQLVASASQEIYVQILSWGVCSITDSFAVVVLPERVWPGDANEDLVVNNYDILAIGIAYAATGPVRPNATLTWQMQCAPAWADSFSNGTNYAYADCNGDGVINYSDTDAIGINYSFTHVRSNNERSGSLPFIVHTNAAVYHAGDTVTGQILLGTVTVPAGGVYGIAFTFNAGPFAVPNTVQLNQANSWMVPDGTGLKFGRQTSSTAIDVAQTGINHTNVAGYGAIADFSFVVDTGIANGSLAIITANTALCINNHGDTIGMYLMADSITAIVNSIYTLRSNDIAVYPNPTTGAIIIQLTGRTFAAPVVQVYDQLGQIILSEKLTKNTNVIDLSSFAAGFYLVKITDQSSLIVTRKICLTK